MDSNPLLDFFAAPPPTSQELETQHWPFGDVHALFRHFNEAFFDNCLRDVVVHWSNRLTRSAGLCKYRGTRTEEHSPIVIILSAPLLQYRSQHDLLDVLVHEMIHAYLFRLKVFERVHHGPVWHAQAHRINQAAGLTIRACHNYYQEVRYIAHQRALKRVPVIDLSNSTIDLTDD
ncbi:SprT-like family protein [Giardia duodenalis]|uniref:SprT-like family protein n=1 Tax=Giardia intestinalis (strain ATCC 50803 / WB clone C6) TaxID=184922 RepID=A0A644EZ47_GIAIC|nr:SprT-like family protein [Giardia intestinalis]XP_001707105.2 SprT-like family protein [Giardia intestinalis]KAE8301638.1 SprT-like family protein [Giardia intestinalis]KAE8301641.1 SprT-like family protein [Giardia intestinalis]